MSHRCPGGCDQTVSDDMLACRSDWYWLPQPVRSAVWATKGLPPFDPERAAALSAAITFYIGKGRTPPPEWATFAVDEPHQEETPT